MQIKRLVFISLLALFSAVGFAYSQDSAEQAPKVCVSGIMYDAKGSLAVVNGESVKEGEEVNGIKVVSISESTVFLECKGQSLERRIGEGCAVIAPLITKTNTQITRIINRSIPSSTPNSKTRIRKVSSKEFASYMLYQNIAIVILFVVAVLFYVYNSVCLQKIAQKTNTPFSWFSWLPIANVFLMFMIARRSFWWILLLLVPFVNFILILIVWMEISKARNKPAWLGILMVLPIANFVILGYLAFSK